MGQADIGLIGLAVMGQNLVLNMNDHGYKVAVFNRTTSKVDDFLATSAKGTEVVGAHSIEEFIKLLKRPRKVMLMVKAGAPVDEFIEHLLPYLEKGDIVIDGGNSYFGDTERRVEELNKRGVLFVGAGISGGEEGARHGPSIMPGGNEAAWPHLKPIFQAIAAKAESGEPCCDWVGSGGSGHYVKMVHNGIEYGDMQIISEAHQLMQRVLALDTEGEAKIFEKWNQGELSSYLIEITAAVLRYKEESGGALLDKILDVAGQKGTGKWASINALDLGQPLTLISEAVFARYLSSLKEERVRASQTLHGPNALFVGDREAFLEDLRQALYASKIVSYAQGFMLMREASKQNNWKINFGSVALMWREGCIIRSRFLGNIKEAFTKTPALESLLLDPFFAKAVNEAQVGWRRTVAKAAETGTPAPCFMTALSFFDGYRSEKLPANLIQALRDYFGAHTYERIDQPRGKFFHTDWSGTGGKVSSTSYNA